MRVDFLIKILGVGISLASGISILLSQKMNGWWLFGIVFVMVGILFERKDEKTDS